jgi:hypothetical protein
MKIFDLTNENIEEAPIQMDPSEPNNPTVYGHEKANPMTLKGRIMQARAQLKELAKMADSNELEVWERITKLSKGGMFMGLEQNFEQIRHGIGELAKKRKKGGTGSRGINKGIGEIDQATSTTPKQQDLGNGFTLTSIDAFGATRKAVLDTSNNTYYILNKNDNGSAIARTPAPYLTIKDGKTGASMGGPETKAAMMKAGLINETTSASSIAAVPNPGVAKTKKTSKIAKNALDTNDNLLGGKPIKR